MKILHVVGARPNFMKLAPVMRALAPLEVRQVLVHTGQHYDPQLSDVFFEELDLPSPDINLEVGSGSHARQTADIMVRLESVIREQRPDWVVVFGDVNSTLAAAIVCAKLAQPVAHVEAGLRSFDRTMPEEINRVLTDHVADLLFTSEPSGEVNLRNEGVPGERIRSVGNTMIDTLRWLLPRSDQRAVLGELRVEDRAFVLVTLHRPSNVDDPATLRALLRLLAEQADQRRILFPIHPRTRKNIAAWDLSADAGRVELLDPLSYLDFLALQRRAAVVMTDSGGIQEETSVLGVPCITIRESTERPATLTYGTNVLVGPDPGRIKAAIAEADARRRPPDANLPPFWDGRAAERIGRALVAAR